MIYFVANNVIKSDKVEKVMKAVDRGNYASSSPYSDEPQRIGYGVTISAPHMVLHKIKYFNGLKFLKDGHTLHNVNSLLLRWDFLDGLFWILMKQ